MYEYIYHIKTYILVSIKTFISLALSFPGTTEHPHFEKKSFRTRKRIFATLSVEKKEVVVKLSAVDQSVFCSIDNTMIHPVKGAWGRQGWTMIHLDKVKGSLLRDALTCAFNEIQPG